MKRLSILYCLLVYLTSIAADKMVDLCVETAPLFRSKISDYHKSVEEFTVKVQDYLRVVQDSEMKSHNSPNVHQARTFIVRNVHNCDHICHEQISAQFGRNRYDIISSDVGLVTTSFRELRDFQETTKSSVITEYAPFYSEMKISPEVRDLTTASTNDCDVSIEKPLTLMFAMHGLSQQEFDRLVEALRGFVSEHETKVRYYWSFSDGDFVESERFRGFLAINNCETVEASVTFLSEQPEVYWVEKEYPIIWHNRWANGVCDSGISEVTPLDDWNIDGEGEVIAISDTGIDMTHCFFYDANTPTPYDTVNLNHRKVVYYITTYGDQYDTTEGHGSHVAGTAAGLSDVDNSDVRQYRGMASQAKIAFADLMTGDSDSGNLNVPSVGLSAMFTNLAQSGARIFTNSWGTSSNSYNSVAQEVDTYMRNNPDSLILFSAGNSGENGFNTVGSPATNKNGIAVGASLNDRGSWQYVLGQSNPSSVYDKDNVAYFSSRGPTADSRLKPDILAPGYFVYSANGNYQSANYHCDLEGKAGTSMSAPTMAGFAAKIRQYYRLGYYPSGRANTSDAFTPSGALLKATLVHSGQRANLLVRNSQSYASLTAYPSNVQGYGRIELNEVLHFGEATTRPITMFVVGGASASDAHYAELLVTGNESKYFFSTNSSSSQPPIRVTFCYTDAAGSFSSSDPLINSLSVSVSSSLGDTFTPYLVSGTRKSNLQVIDIPSPTPSTNYTVTITADRILQSPQPYAMVITGQLSYLNATSYPSSSSSDNSLDLQSLLIYIIVPVVIAVIAVVLWMIWSCCCSRRSNYAQTSRREPRQELPVVAQAHVVERF